MCREVECVVKIHSEELRGFYKMFLNNLIKSFIETGKVINYSLIFLCVVYPFFITIRSVGKTYTLLPKGLIHIPILIILLLLLLNYVRYKLSVVILQRKLNNIDTVNRCSMLKFLSHYHNWAKLAYSEYCFNYSVCVNKFDDVLLIRKGIFKSKTVIKPECINTYSSKNKVIVGINHINLFVD